MGKLGNGLGTVVDDLADGQLTEDRQPIRVREAKRGANIDRTGAGTGERGADDCQLPLDAVDQRGLVASAD